ncbi:MAG: ATPase [Anaerolineae bacterium]
MEILYLIDRLETLLNRSRRVAFLPGVLIDREECQEIIDQMRIHIPQEIKDAQRLGEERQKVLAQAEQEAERVLAKAREEATSLTDEEGLAKAAEAKSQEITEEARLESERLKREADAYSLQVLGQLEDELARVLTTVRNGMDYIHQSRDEPTAPTEEEGE